MDYRYVKTSEIVEFANRFAESKASILPVSPWRAVSQAENPDADPGDTLLIAAFDEDAKLAGYIGLLPFRMHNSSNERIFWNTCWWTAPHAGASTSLALFSRFLKETGKRVVFSDMTEKTAEILRRLKGYRLASRSGVVLRFRHAYHIRIRNSRNSSHGLRIIAATGLPRLAEFILNAPVKRRMRHWLSAHPVPCAITVREELEEHHVEFAREHGGEYFSIPSIERYNWWKKHPWMVPPDKARRRIAHRYYFSSLATRNDLFVLECTCNETLAGFAIISHRDGVLKTQYMYSRDDMKQAFCQTLLGYLVTLSGAHTLVTFHEDFAQTVRNQSPPKVSMREAERHTAFSESLKDMPGIGGILQDGDGDYIFT